MLLLKCNIEDIVRITILISLEVLKEVKGMLIKSGLVLVDEKLVKKDLLVKDGKIVSIEDHINEGSEEVIEANGLMVLPGIIDQHTHGGNGYDINNIGIEDFEKLCEFYASKGTTGFLASLLIDSKENLLRCIDYLKQYQKEEHSGAKLLGIHMEGPYFAQEFKAAMPPEMIRNASVEEFDEFYDRAEGTLKMMTISGEVDNAVEVIKEGASKGVVMAIGHSGPTYERSCQCIEAGAKTATHLFNAMRPFEHHTPGIVGAALESDIYTEVICDGHHLHPATLRMIIKCKGVDKVIAITDSMMAAGLKDGQYKLGRMDVTVKGLDARLTGKSTRAGSVLTAIEGMKNIKAFTNLEINDIVKMTSINAAKELGIFDHKGSISIGKDADIIITDSDLNLSYTIVEGKIAYQK